MSTTRSVRRFVPLAALLMVLAGCASVTPIGDLLSNSSKYNGKTVRVKGEVSKSRGRRWWRVPIRSRMVPGLSPSSPKGRARPLRAQRWA